MSATQNIFAIPSVTSSVNVGPMTTPAKLPDDCLASLWDFNTLPLWPYNPYSWTYYTLGCAVSSCCPGSLEPYSTPYQWLSSYLSPAVCPESYKTCAGPAAVTPGPGETVAFCCPEKFNCPGPAEAETVEWWACQSDLDSTTIALLMDNPRNQRTLGTESISAFRPTQNGVQVQERIVAYPIQIRWKAADRVTPTPGEPTAASSPTSGSTAASTAGASPSHDTAKKVGLGVGLGVFGLIVVAGVLFWVAKLRKPKQPLPPDAAEKSAELDATMPPRAELPDRSEQSKSSEPIELQADPYIRV